MSLCNDKEIIDLKTRVRMLEDNYGSLEEKLRIMNALPSTPEGVTAVSKHLTSQNEVLGKQNAKLRDQLADANERIQELTNIILELKKTHPDFRKRGAEELY